jgi:acetolactate synthase-1/2/3 large subunit
VKLAGAFGAEGRTVRSMEELRAAFRGGFPEDRPCILDCRIGMDEMVFPMIPPGGSVKDILVG